MADSVGKIALDIDIRSRLDKEIKSASDMIGKGITQSLKSTLSRQTRGFRNILSNAFKVPEKTFEMPKKQFDMSFAVNENDRLAKTIDNLNQQMDIQRQKLADLRQEYNQGLSDKIKHAIEQQEAVMRTSEIRIESLRIKLRELQQSYNNAVNPERKNKLLQEIAKTEAQMTTLMARSDNALHKINELEKGLSGPNRNALRERIVRTEASLLSLEKRAERVRNEMQKTDKGFKNVGKSAQKAERPVNRLGKAFDGTRERMNNMTKSFTSGFKRIAKQVLIFAVMYKAIRSVQDYMSGAMKTNEQFTNSLQQIRTNLQVAFAPIFQAVMPALQAFINWLAKATTYVAAFISAIFGNTYQQSFKAAQGINNARNALDGFGKSARKASKDAKKAQRDLAGFDEINVLSSNDDAGAGGLSAGAGGIAPLVAPEIDVTGVQGKVDSLVAGMKRTFSTAFDFIRKGWQWTVDTFGPSFQKGWSKVSTELDKWKGTFSRVFSDIISLGDPFANWINNHVVPLYQKGIENIGSIYAGFIETSRNVYETLWDVAFPILENFITQGLPLLTDFASGAIDIFTDYLSFMKEIFDSMWADVVDPALRTISDIVIDGLNVVFDWFRDWGSRILENVRGTFDGLKEIWRSLWDNFLQPFVSNMLSMLTDLWDDHLNGLVRELGNFIGKLITSAQDIFNKFILPIVNWLTKTLGPIFNVVFSGIGGMVFSVVGSIIDVISGLLKALGGVIDFLTGVFTGDWERAWNGLKDIFKGIADSLIAVIKAPINGIIGALNGVIRGMNKIKVPKWVPGIGGKGINIAEIPKLAQGGIIDQPTLAMVGEAGTEAVMPLENNTGWINNLAGQIANQMGGSSVGNDESVKLLREIVDVLLQILNALLNNDTEIIMKLQETEFGRATIRAINNVQTQVGKTLIKV